MSMHQDMQVHVPADPWMLFCPECSHKMRIVMSIPTHDGRERRTYGCAFGHRESIVVSRWPPQRLSRLQREGCFATSPIPQETARRFSNRHR